MNILVININPSTFNIYRNDYIMVNTSSDIIPSILYFS